MERTSSHDESVIEMLSQDEDFALDYLATALEEIDEEGGRHSLPPCVVSLKRVV